MPVEVRRLLAACGTARAAPAGEVLARAGDPVRQVHVVLDGLVLLARPAPRRPAAVHAVRAGGVVGDAELFSAVPAAFDAVCLERSLLLTADVGSLLAALRAHPQLLGWWLASAARRLHDARRRTVALLTRDVEQRVAAVLLAESGAGEIALSQAVLADLAGAHRTTANRVLAALEDEGLVRAGYRKVAVVDREGLARRAGEPQPVAPEAPRARRSA